MTSTAQPISTGYLNSHYTQSFREAGDCIPLTSSRGWLLRRSIRDTRLYDAMGCYPLFCCDQWRNLATDLHELQDNLVTVTLVADPFGNYREQDLQACFPDLCRPFKQHFVIDLSQQPDAFVCSHHRRYGKKASKDCVIEHCQQTDKLLDDWVELYQNLVHHHDIRGFLRFSPEIFARQLAVPGIDIFRASQGGETLGMAIWYRQGDIAYCHLAAYSENGYRAKASFGLFWQAIHYFREAGLHWLNLGAGAGLHGDGQDGLSRYKEGWSTGSKTSYLCGRICNPAAYAELVRATGKTTSQYFPAYREGEFG